MRALSRPWHLGVLGRQEVVGGALGVLDRRADVEAQLPHARPPIGAKSAATLRRLSVRSIGPPSTGSEPGRFEVGGATPSR